MKLKAILARMGTRYPVTNGKFVYCLECEGWFEHAYLPDWGHVHQISTPIYNDRNEVEGVDNELCYFPCGYTYSKPPEVDSEWNLHVQEPGDDEVLIADLYSLDYFGQELVEA